MKGQSDQGVVTLRDVWNELKDSNQRIRRLEIAMAVVIAGGIGNYLGLGDTVSQAMPFK